MVESQSEFTVPPSPEVLAPDANSSEQLPPKETTITTSQLKHAVTEALPSRWKYSPICSFNLQEFMERADGYTHLIKEGGLNFDPQEVEKFQKKTVSIFVVGKRRTMLLRL